MCLLIDVQHECMGDICCSDIWLLPRLMPFELILLELLPFCIIQIHQFSPNTSMFIFLYCFYFY